MAVNDLATLLLGEAGGKNAAERYLDMLNIASVVHNRAASTGKTVQEIIAAPGEFGAWGKPLPPGVEQYAHLAQRAMQQVAKSGPVTAATFYATPSAVGNLPKGLKSAGQTAGHRFFTDPQNRAIGTTAGYVRPAAVSLPATAPAPSSAASFRPDLVAPQLPDLAAVPARNVPSVSVAGPLDPRSAVPPIEVPTSRVPPGPGMGALVPQVARGVATPPAGAMTSPYDARRGAGLTDGPVPLPPGPPGMQFANRDLTDPIPYSRGATQNALPYAGAVIHHAEPVTLGQLREVTNNPRNSAGHYFGYHFGIDQAGNVGLLAPLDKRVNHVGDVAPKGGDFNNRNSLAVTMTDAYNPASAKQIAAAGELFSALNRSGYAKPDGSPAFDPAEFGWHGKGATPGRGPAEGQAEAQAIAAYMGNMPFGRQTPTPTPRPDPAQPLTAPMAAVERGGALPPVPALPPSPNFAGGLSPRGADAAALPIPAAMPAMPAPVSFPGPMAFAPDPTPRASPFDTQRSPAPPIMSPMPPALPTMPSAAQASPRNASFAPTLPASLTPPAPSAGFAFAPPARDIAQMQPPAIPTPALTPPVAMPSPASRMLSPPMAPPQQLAPPPLMVRPPVPTPAPRGNPALAFRGGLLGPAMQQIGQNLRSNMRGERIGLFAGLPAAYGAAFRGIGDFFGAKPSYAGPFNNIGSGYSAISSVFGAAPGTSAFANDGSRFTSLGNGFAERTSPYGIATTMQPGEYDDGSWGKSSDTGKGSGGKGK